ncbi:MAG: hypothetical protein U0319_09760 [Nitrospira sp.]
MQGFTPAFAYFLIVFGAGFLLGTIRVLLLLPVLGERAAELLEMPFMLIVIVLAARWIDRRFLAGVDDRGRIVVGLLAFGLVLSAEFVVGIALRGMTPRDVLFARDPVSGAAYYLSLLLFAVMPWLIAQRRRR